MTEHMSPIPSRIYNAAVGGHVCGPEDVDFGQKVVHLIKYDRAGNEVSFESQVTQANKIYVIHDDFVLSSNVNIPTNCVLEFDGGSISGAYTITGNNTSIQANLVKIFNTDIILAGTWNVAEAYPEWFGAVGDGVTDDTAAIYSLTRIGRNISFCRKTYIINVVAGDEPNTQRIFFPLCSFAKLNGNGAVIKLGNNNNCDKRINKGFACIFQVVDVTKEPCVIQGLTIDFNYAENPIFQLGGRTSAYEENTQQEAFAFSNVYRLVIDNCTFIGHSGNNCIDYASAITPENLNITISNCKFLSCGGTSYYDNNGTIETAAHDVSTCALHYRINGSCDNTFVCNIHDNYFEAIGMNGHNAIETSPHVLNFHNNVFKGFHHCIMPCTYQEYMEANIVDNIFLDCGTPIKLWTHGYFDTTPTNKVGFKSLVIKDNICKINIPLMLQYRDFTSLIEDGLGFYGFVGNMPGVTRSLGNLTVENNYIEYVNIANVDPSIFTARTCPINLVSEFEDVNNTTLAICYNLVIKGNTFKNCPEGIIYDIVNQTVENFVFSYNTIVSPASVNDLESFIRFRADTLYPQLGPKAIGDVRIECNYLDNSASNVGSDYHLINNYVVAKAKNDNILLVTGNKAYNHNKQWVFNRQPYYNDIFSKIVIRNTDDIQESGTTTQRPSLLVSDSGFKYFDTTLGKPIYWNGTDWVDATGATV